MKTDARTLAVGPASADLGNGYYIQPIVATGVATDHAPAQAGMVRVNLRPPA
ncbi:hypothetical protein [Alicyclobacillus kakegawensis]|uniref:hypothetical protein n=1 Tax=Alicyclobacillus kakegawensis TaxID=392012 RepID=UPI0012EDADCA|nr:hypothetical protein [Alicyclobacillus kakegawensis]